MRLSDSSANKFQCFSNSFQKNEIISDQISKYKKKNCVRTFCIKFDNKKWH